MRGAARRSPMRLPRKPRISRGRGIRAVANGRDIPQAVEILIFDSKCGRFCGLEWKSTGWAEGKLGNELSQAFPDSSNGRKARRAKGNGQLPRPAVACKLEFLDYFFLRFRPREMTSSATGARPDLVMLSSRAAAYERSMMRP